MQVIQEANRTSFYDEDVINLHSEKIISPGDKADDQTSAARAAETISDADTATAARASKRQVEDVASIANCLQRLLAPIAIGTPVPIGKCIVELYWRMCHDSNDSQLIIVYCATLISVSEGDCIHNTKP